MAAVDAAFPPTPLNIMARRINRLASLLPKGHECEPIFDEFDALGQYVHRLEDVLESAVKVGQTPPFENSNSEEAREELAERVRAATQSGRGGDYAR